MNRYPQCCVCKHADKEKQKCKKDSKSLKADAMVFGMCRNYCERKQE